MLRLTVNTDRSVTEVVSKARRFFTDGLGLVSDAAAVEGTISFTGAGGFVTLEFRSEHGKTAVDILTQEFDGPVREFARELA